MRKQHVNLGLIILSFFILFQCNKGNDSQYYLTYSKNNGAFADQVAEKQTKNLNYYQVYYQSGQISHFHYYKDNKLYSKHERKYGSNGLLKQNNLDLNDHMLSIDHFSKEGLIQKIDLFNQKNQLIKEEIYQSLKIKIPNVKKEQTVMIRTINHYPDQPAKKEIVFYKYLKLKLQQKRLHKVEDKIEKYDQQKLQGKIRFYYDDRAKKTHYKHYVKKKLYQIVYYNTAGYIEEERTYNENKKIILKKFFDRDGKVIKEVKKTPK